MNNTLRLSLIPALLGLHAAAFAQAQDTDTLPSVVVTGQAPDKVRKDLEVEQARTPGAVTLLDRDQLAQRNVSTTADMLRFVPGVWAASSSGSDATFLSIRGSNLDAVDYDNSGVKLLQDGLPVTAADGNNHNRFVDPLSARHIVVARGANALTYGANTLGGAIDFISPTGLDSPPLEMWVNAGSFGQRQARITAAGASGKLDGLVSLEAKDRDGYRDHNNQQRRAVYANGGLKLSDSVRTRFYLDYVKNDEELPGVLTRAQWQGNPRQAEAAAAAGHYQWNVETARIANKTTWDIDSDSRLSVGFSYETQQLYHPIVQNPFFSLLIDTEQRNAGLSLRYELRRGAHELLAGLNYGRTEVEGGNYGNNRGRRTALATLVDNDAHATEAFLMDRWQFAPGWSAVYGAQAVSSARQIRNVTVATGALRNPAADFDSINPRAGLIYQMAAQTEVFANVSRLYEAPTTYQMDDQENGNNQTLDAMKGVSFEVGSRGRQTLGRGRWHWETALYYARIRDEILSVDDPAAPGTSLSSNVDKTIHAGVEALVGASLPFGESSAHRIEPLLNLTLNHFRFDGNSRWGDNRLPAAPRYALRAEALYRNANGFFAGPTLDVVGKRYADFANSYQIPSYSIWGLRAGYAARGWEVYGEIRNLGDKDFIARNSVTAVSSLTAAILSPGEPRSAYFGVRRHF
jgi:iron complex outermembrane receptor protein